MSASEKYKLFHRIGSGGYGDVYLGAMQGPAGSSRRVAIKRLCSPVNTDAIAVQRFTEEAELLTRLDHPNVVSIIDYHIDSDGHPSLIMGYVDGCDLAKCLIKGALPPSVAVYVAVEMLRALAYLHQMPTEAGMRGLVHRDVSPQNILLSWTGTVVLSDFGISKVMDTRGVQSETFRGKPCYSAPENLNNQVTDGRADLFSVGVVLWEMIAGHPLFLAKTLEATLARVLYATAPSLSTMTSISPELAVIVSRLLERKPKSRYAAAEDVIRDLLACAEWPRSGRDELSALLASRFGRDTRVILPVEDSSAKQQGGSVEDCQETRTTEPTEDAAGPVGLDWDQVAELVESRASSAGRYELDSEPSRHVGAYRRGWVRQIAWAIASSRSYRLAAVAVVLLLLAYVFHARDLRQNSERGAAARSTAGDPATPRPALTPLVVAPLAREPTGPAQPQVTTPQGGQLAQPALSNGGTRATSPDLKKAARKPSSRRAAAQPSIGAPDAKSDGASDTSRYPETMRYILGTSEAPASAASP